MVHDVPQHGNVWAHENFTIGRATQLTTIGATLRDAVLRYRIRQHGSQLINKLEDCGAQRYQKHSRKDQEEKRKDQLHAYFASSFPGLLSHAETKIVDV